ncbi:MAG: alkaline phosphatase D family protein [Bacteroidota bacterium]
MRILFFLTLAGLALVQCTPKEPTYVNQLVETGFDLTESMAPFYHGVASGDPQQTSVLLWTRVTPPFHQPVTVSWKLAEDARFSKVIASGSVKTDRTKDYTVKVIPEGLTPGTRYYYQFEAFGKSSITGRTNTFPEGDVDAFTLAFASCSNYQFGPFNAYNRIADNDTINAVLHLGDYIYEYEAGRYGDSTTTRFHIPDTELTTLQDYRERYAQYRLDEGLRRAHQQHPFINIWDDHELSNNAYDMGAQNHQPETEGTWDAKKAAAVQAYFEWLPVRDEYKPTLYRSFSIGNLADLMMLEGRLQRTQQADSVSEPSFGSTDRTMLGEQQKNWLKTELSNSKATWRIMGNQVMFSDLNVAHVNRGKPKFLDMWAGYPVEQQELVRFFEEDDIDNILIFTGDFHSSLSSEVTHSALNPSVYSPENGNYAMASEFVVHSVNAANYNEYIGDEGAREIDTRYKNPEYNPNVVYANTRDHGYVLLKLTDEEAIVEYRYVHTTKTWNPDEKPKTILRVPADTAKIEVVQLEGVQQK